MNTPNEESKPMGEAAAETRSPTKTDRDPVATDIEIAAEVVRTLIAPDAIAKSEDSDRSPTKTDRDLASIVIPEATSEPDAVRKPLVPEE